MMCPKEIVRKPNIFLFLVKHSLTTIKHAHNSRITFCLVLQKPADKLSEQVMKSTLLSKNNPIICLRKPAKKLLTTSTLAAFLTTIKTQPLLRNWDVSIESSALFVHDSICQSMTNKCLPSWQWRYRISPNALKKEWHQFNILRFNKWLAEPEHADSRVPLSLKVISTIKKVSMKMVFNRFVSLQVRNRDCIFSPVTRTSNVVVCQ